MNEFVCAHLPPIVIFSDCLLDIDIFWVKDESLEDSANLPAPEVIAAEIAEDLRTALEQFEAIQVDLSRRCTK